MIEVLRARNGEPTLAKDGRSLASTRDPSAEADAWVRRGLSRLSPQHRVFVLGAGSGYGIAALMRKLGSTRVCVFEPDAEIVGGLTDLAQAGEAGLVGFDLSRIVSVETPETAVRSPVATELLDSPYAILINGAAVGGDAAWYSRARELLIARDPQSFRFELARRSSLARSFRADAVADWTELVSVKSVVDAFAPESSGRDRALWSALRELAK